MRKFRGFKSLVHDLVDGVVDLVNEGHESTSRSVLRATDLVPPLAGPARAVDTVRRFGTRGVLGSIKLVNRVVQAATDAGLDLAEGVAADGSRTLVADNADPGRSAIRLEPAVPMRSDIMLSPTIVGDAAIGLLNGAVGDQLFAKENGLDMGLALRIRDSYVDPTDEVRLRASVGAAFALGERPPGPRVAVFAHGLATTEWSWVLEAAAYHGDPTTTFGTLLEHDLGLTPVYVRYNTGRRISTNGRALSQALEALVRAYPVPVEELVLVGHSMGGLVIRSACHYGADSGAAWVPLVNKVFCLGSPHRGAPLEKVGHLLTSALASVDLPGTQIPAKILERRSAGIKDLRHGALVEADWVGRDPDALADDAHREVPLLPHVTYHFISATVTQDPEHPLGHLIGDLLVRMPSSTGTALQESTFPIERAHFGGVLHHQLQNHPEIYEVIRRACESPKPTAT